MAIKNIVFQINTLFSIFTFCLGTKYQLLQILLLSRHNVRTPLTANLVEITPKHWPSWKEEIGHATAKGLQLEAYMGVFFKSWMLKEGLLPKGCPDDNTVHVFASNKQRTLKSADAFLSMAFLDCNITVHYSKDNNVINPVIHNDSHLFKTAAMLEMQTLLKSLPKEGLDGLLENILDYENSDSCKVKKKCKFNFDDAEVGLLLSEEPYLIGALKISNLVVDAFQMQYYEGFPMEDVAWGRITDHTQWQQLMKFNLYYHNVLFNTTLVAKDIVQPLLKYMSNIFVTHEPPKMSLLMVHDANIYTIMNVLNFKPYNLVNQYEKTPIGGKVVFQKWLNKETNTELLKINYMYQSSLQLRNSMELNLDNPPQSVLLELRDCEVDSNGFCAWNNFLNILQSSIEV